MTIEVERALRRHPDVVERVARTTVRRELADQLHRSRLRPQESELFALQPGRVIALHGGPGSGMTRLGLSLMVEASLQAPVAVVDARGWVSPLAAWEVGIRPERLVVIRADLPTWPHVVSALMDGIGAVYAEVPKGVRDDVLRRAVAVARTQQVGLVLRPLAGRLPAGVAHLTVDAETIEWDGAGEGHGHIRKRALRVTASGKAARGMERLIEIEDDGTNTLRVVERVAPSAARRTAG